MTLCDHMDQDRPIIGQYRDLMKALQFTDIACIPSFRLRRCHWMTRMRDMRDNKALFCLYTADISMINEEIANTFK